MVKNIVIVGGGYAGVMLGTKLERSLSKHHDYRIIMIEKKTYFYHIIAAPRAAVEDWDVLIPYTHLFKENKNQVIHATAMHLNKHSVILDTPFEGSTELPFDYCILATGIKYPIPSKIYDVDVADGSSRMAEIRSMVAKAESIMVIGGGAAGIELTGEIRENYKDKKITLVHSHDHLLQPSFSIKDRAYVLEKVRRNNIHVILEEKVVLPAGVPDVFVPEKPIISDKGTILSTVDLVMVAFGNHADTDWLLQQEKRHDILAPNGYIRAKPTLQVDAVGYEHMYTLGDAADIDELKLAFSVKRQVPVVVHNLMQAIQGRGHASMEEYKSKFLKMEITLGKSQGVLMTPLGTFGNWASKKGKDQLTRKLWKMMNAGEPSKYPTDTNTTEDPPTFRQAQL
ncbi:FAD/NAD(P)-binding domain-containing protein [Lichtheimia hyalospora FSU 10163]|nr:FAD/NAD(P)-binding domain-containing protein [Lichtheimia hyalospora FSU 10163]